MRRIGTRALAFALAMSSSLGAQASPPVRSLGPIVARSPVAFTNLRHFVALSDGRILVSDFGKNLVLMLDPTLSNATVVLDSVLGKDNSFAAGWAPSVAGGTPPGGASLGAQLAPTMSFLAPFRGDSSIWYNVAVGSFAVLDPAGRLQRAIRPPNRNDGVWTSLKPPVVSAKAGLIYSDNLGRQVLALIRQPPVPVGETRWQEDSLEIIRWNFDTRVADTLARIWTGQGTWSFSQPRVGTASSPAPPGAMTTSNSGGTALYPFYDDVAATTDGTIAIFRGREFRIEWFGADGKAFAATKLTHPWRRFTDTDRQRIIDSVNAKRMSAFDSAVAKRAADSARTGVAPTRTTTRTVDGVATTREVPAPPPSRPRLVAQNEVPDFAPPTGSNPLLADADNRVWLRTLQAGVTPGFVVWNVISRTDGVVDRVEVSATQRIIGFGPGGFVYLVSTDAGVQTLVKARVK